jgi:hypothetical protein
VSKVAGDDQDEDEDEDEVQMSFQDVYYEVFSQACRTIRDHPLLANVKVLHIDHGIPFIDPTPVTCIANEAGQLLKTVGPLEELICTYSDIRLYLTPFFVFPDSYYIEPPVAFPPIKGLTILHPLPRESPEEWMASVVGFAKSQHARGVPFEYVTIRMEDPPAEMVERLRPWVGAVYCYSEIYDRGPAV